MSLWDDNGVKMSPGAPAVIGKGEIRALMEAIYGAPFDWETTSVLDEAEIAGDWIFSRGSFTLSMTPKEGGETSTSIGKSLDILKRQADGSWKIYVQSWNYDAPPPAGKLAGTARAPGLAKLAQEDDADAMFREMCDLYALAVNTGDVDLYLTYYTDDGVQMPPDEPTRIGSGQIRAAMGPALALFDAEIALYPQEAVIAGDWAFGWCNYSLSLTPKEGGPTTTFPAAKDLDVFKRQADGSWKSYISSWSYSGPPTVTTSVEATSWGEVKQQFE